MPQVQVCVSIPLSVEKVFDFLADGCNLPTWHSGVMAIRPAGPDGPVPPAGAPCAYRYRFPGRRRDCWLVRTVYEPPTRIGFAGERMWTPLGTQSPRYDFRLWPQEDSCRVEIRVTCSLTAGMLAFWPVVALGWRRDLPVDAQRLYERLTGCEEAGEVVLQRHVPDSLLPDDAPLDDASREGAPRDDVLRPGDRAARRLPWPAHRFRLPAARG